MNQHTLRLRVPLFAAREVGHRLTVSFVSLSTLLLCWLEPSSLRAHSIQQSGAEGWAFTIVLASMSVVAILDVLVNDLLPDRYSMPTVLWGRMYAYMLQAAMNMSLLVAMVGDHGWVWTAAIHAVIAASSVWIAVVDTYHRFVEPRHRN